MPRKKDTRKRVRVRKSRSGFKPENRVCVICDTDFINKGPHQKTCGKPVCIATNGFISSIIQGYKELGKNVRVEIKEC